MNFFRGATLTVVVVVLVIVGFLLSASMFVVDERELAVVVQFGKPVRSIEEPGLYFKTPFIQNVKMLPKTLQLWKSDEDISDLPTVDGKKIEVASWAIWKITDPIRFIDRFITVEKGQLAVKDRVRASIRDEITSHNLSELVRSTDRELTYSFGFELPGSENDKRDKEIQKPVQPGSKQNIEIGREKILAKIKENVRKRLEGEEDGESDRGLTLVDVGISNIGFVPAVREAAFERLKAFMDSIASGYTNSGEQRKQEILNQTAAEVEQILGEGEEKSNIIRGNADAEIIDSYAKAITDTGDLYVFLKQLEVYEKSLGKKTRIIMTTDSELFQLLQKSGEAEKKKE